jgi:hypothetical protein
MVEEMSRRDPNLWFTALSVRVEPVRKAHKKECVVCGLLPKGKRLRVVVGSARAAVTFIFCREHGATFVNRRIEEALRVIELLRFNTSVGIREDVIVGDPSWRPPKKPKAPPRRDAV